MAGRAIVHSYNPHKDVVVAREAARGQVGAARAQAAGQIGAAEAAGRAARDSSLAQALANEAVGRSSSLGMAEAARQASVGNIGSAALGAYGSAANSALGAWAANQSAYNRSLADMHTANQQGLANVGSTRNSALAGLGSSYADMAGRMAGANALANMNFNFSGDGLSASGSASSASGAGLPAADITKRGFDSLDSLRDRMMGGDVLGMLNEGGAAGLRQLQTSYEQTRDTPSRMLGDTLTGLRGFANDAYGQTRAGMDQLHAALPREIDIFKYSSLLNGLMKQPRQDSDYLEFLSDKIQSPPAQAPAPRLPPPGFYNSAGVWQNA